MVDGEEMYRAYGLHAPGTVEGIRSKSLRTVLRIAVFKHSYGV
jgi:hypothetical protein